MLKKMVTYEDFNGVERTEAFYFNLTQAELLSMESTVPGGLAAYVEGIGKAQDSAAVLRWIDEFIGWCYGEKSEDGRSFVKDPARLSVFRTSEAYSEIVSGLIEDPDEMSAFFEGVMPQKLMKEYRKTVEKYGSEEKALEGLRVEQRKSLEN